MINTKQLTTRVFQEGMKKLEFGFRVRELSTETIQVYYSRVNFVTDKEFSQAVDNILDKEQWFPTIKVLLDWLPEPEVFQPSLEDLIS